MKFTKIRGLIGTVFTGFLLSLGSACNSSRSVANQVQVSAGDLRYLALGDSITFGDNLYIDLTVSARPDPEAFVSYATLLGKESYGRKYVNLSCPGETSSSFLDEKAQDNGCHEAYRPVGLKTQYSGSQLDAMVRYIVANPKLELITITLGGNDFFVLGKNCASVSGSDGEAVAQCVKDGLPEVLDIFVENMKEIFTTARSAGFRGKFVAVGAYSVDFRETFGTESARDSNMKLQKVLAPLGGLVSQAFEQFRDKASAVGGDVCASGLLIKKPIAYPEPASACDVHPSFEGHRILAKSVLQTIH